jgi:DNA-binding response OmpR family regulator
MSTKSNSLVVLLVEDSEDDRFFFEHAFNHAESGARLFLAKDGIEAIEFLRNERNAPESPPLPDVMFLDLKMPDCDGFDVLRWMKEHSLLEAVKVFILSGSSEPQDVALAKELGASDYLVKPLKFKRLKELLKTESVPDASS